MGTLGWAQSWTMPELKVFRRGAGVQATGVSACVCQSLRSYGQGNPAATKQTHIPALMTGVSLVGGDGWVSTVAS